MKAAISRLNQSGVNLDEDAVRTIQAASRPDWNPAEQLVLVTIPDLSQQPGEPLKPSERGSEGQGSLLRSAAHATLRPHWPSVASDVTLVAGVQEVPQKTSQRQAEFTPDRAVDTPEQLPHRPKVAISPPQELPAAEGGTSPPVPAPIPQTKPLTAGPSEARSTGHVAVVESIVARFGSSPSFLIHFCDIDQPRRSAEVCLSVGFDLAERTQRRILLLDSSRTHRPLSGLLGVDLAAGFREAVRTGLNWRNLVRPTSHPLVEVLPAGVIKLSSSNGPEQELVVRKLVAELGQRYGGICSCADSAYDLETDLLGRCCSGAFLTIDFQLTSRGLARAAAQQMQLSGNRLLGCIAAAIPE